MAAEALAASTKEALLMALQMCGEVVAVVVTLAVEQEAILVASNQAGQEAVGM